MNIEKIISKVIISTVLFICSASFAYLLWNVRQQSDDLGFVNFINHYGSVLSFYIVERETMEVSLSYLIFIFPLIILSQYIGSFSVLILIYGIFALSIFNILKIINSKYQFTDTNRTIFVFSIMFVLFLVFTSWNRNTYQNACFWITGVFCYIVPLIILNFSFVSAFKKKAILSFILYFLLANTRINLTFIVIAGHFIFFILYWKQIKGSLKFWLWPSLGMALGAIYYINSPGNWVRYGKESGNLKSSLLDTLGTIKVSEIILNIDKCFTEPAYLSFFVLLSFLIFSQNTSSSKVQKISKRFFINLLLIYFILFYFHTLFINIILKGSFGYGRIYIFMQYFFVFICLISIKFIFDHFEFTKHHFFKKLIWLLFGVFFIPFIKEIRFDIYRARRFSEQYDKRMELIQYVKKHETNVSCLFFDRFKNSGIIGYLDLPEGNSCNSLRKDTWIYTTTPSYDHWVFEKYYDLDFKIAVINTPNELDKTFKGLRYKITRNE
jgi:hypothetical protein